MLQSGCPLYQILRYCLYYFKEADTAKLKNITFWTAKNEVVGSEYRLADKNDALDGRYIYIQTMKKHKSNKENVKSRKFLKKNKDKIIEFDFIEQHGAIYTFLIEERELKKRKMTLFRMWGLCIKCAEM